MHPPIKRKIQMLPKTSLNTTNRRLGAVQRNPRHQYFIKLQVPHPDVKIYAREDRQITQKAHKKEKSNS